MIISSRKVSFVLCKDENFSDFLFWQGVLLDNESIGHIAKNYNTDKDFYFCAVDSFSCGRIEYALDHSGYFNNLLDAQNAAVEFAKHKIKMQEVELINA